MRILIAGAGKVGMALTKELSEEGHDITIIDQRGWVLEDAMEKYDVITLEGNAASQRILEEAEVRKMDLFIAATNADEINMLACLTAHALAPSIKTIARIRDPEYVEQAYAMKDVFSLSLV
ncbi:MAG: NAD-binding protein, partial [Solobacterium sp.]|nr:NAD-binding protein [Solobacterium sp.]